MAQPCVIYRASIQLSDLDRNIYETLQTTVAKHPSETEERMLVRLLAYAVCYESDLTFTRGVAAGDEPDLWTLGPDGRVKSWIEVGLPDGERLVKAGRHAEKVLLLAFGSARNVWEKQQLAKLAEMENVKVYGLDQQFLGELIKELKRSISWSLTITEGTLYLTVDGRTIESSLELLKGSRD
jgi:uncharacterized protein YaeQ